MAQTGRKPFARNLTVGKRIVYGSGVDGKPSRLNFQLTFKNGASALGISKSLQECHLNRGKDWVV